MEESFAVHFEGPAFASMSISPFAVGQSLCALDGLVRRCARIAGGQVNGHAGGHECELDVAGSARPRSFTFSLRSPAAGTVAGLTSLLQLGTWAQGKRVSVLRREAASHVLVENCHGDVCSWNRTAVAVYTEARTQSLLSRFTHTLDREGAERIVMTDGAAHTVCIGLQERCFFRHEDGLVLTDNEHVLVLEVLAAPLKEKAEDWRFSDGSCAFSARVEDEIFLAAVTEGTIRLVPHLVLYAVVRTVQVQKMRLTCRRSIVQVREILCPQSAAQDA